MEQDHNWDKLLRDALQEEETPPIAVQHHLKQQIRQRSEWTLPWWLPAVAGMIQTIALVIAIQLVLPNTLFAGLSLAGGVVAIVGGTVLSWQVKRRMKKKEREWQWG